MKRLKRVGFCAVLALALTSIGGVASASASSGFLPVNEYGSEGQLASYRGTAVGDFENVFSFGGNPCELPMDSYDETGPQGPSPTTALVVGYPFTSCINTLLGDAEISMDGCRIFLHPGEGEYDIGPVGCGPIRFHWFSNCDGYLYPKSGITATYRNTSSSIVDVTAEATGLRYVLDCGIMSNTYNNATYETHWEIEAFTVEGGSTDFRVASIPGAYLAGAGSATTADEPRFEADGYPKSIGDGAGGFSLRVITGSASCSADYDAELGGAVDALSVDASYGSCSTSGAWSAVIDMNSCYYELGVQNAGPDFSDIYSGTFGIACDQRGDVIEFAAYSGATLLCTAEVGPQSGLEGVDLANVFDDETGIGVDVDVSGVDYELVPGVNCGGQRGSHTDGVLSLDASLFGA